MAMSVNTVRLYPSQAQGSLMREYASASRWVWNWGLNTRKQRWEQKISTGPYDLLNMLVTLKTNEEFNWLTKIPAQAMQETLMRQTKAIGAFYKRRAKYPKFKKRNHRDSFTYPQYVRIDDRRHIRLPKISCVKMRGYRHFDGGVLKTATIENVGGTWYAHLMFDIPDIAPLPASTAIVGVDLGVTHLVTVHDGEKAVHYHHNTEAIRKSEERIKLYQRKMSRCVKGSKNRESWLIKLQKECERLRNIRKDTLHKLSSKLVNENSLIVLESLQDVNMMKSASGTKENPGKNVAAKRGLNRSIQRQGWGMFTKMLTQKAKASGCKVALVDPKYTSQTCPKCKHRAAENRLTQAKFVCVNCGYADNADAVAAFNIRTIGTIHQNR
jgi:putative transposase